NPKIPPIVATIAVAPNTKLADHQLVTVTGKGFAPATTTFVSECVTRAQSVNGQICDYATQRYVGVDSNGTFTATNVVLERRQAVFTRSNRQTLLDCATKPDTCEIQASASGPGSSSNPATSPLTFGRYIKPAVAAAQLSQSSSLQDLQPVTLTGTGFTPGYAVNVQECVGAGTTISSCDYSTSRAVTTGFAGQFTLTYFVRRDLTAFVFPTGPTTTDCAITACELIVQGTPAQPTTTLPLAFDPNVPAVTPTIVANPNTGLSDNQSITVSVNGYTPEQPVQVIECSKEAVTETNGFSYCDFTTAQIITPAGPLTAQTSFVVRRVLNGQDGLQDCTTEPGACVLIAAEGGGYYGGGVPIGVITPGPSQPGVASTSLTFTKP
ncbi:MAG TPA: neocarzinostatin apoprotein domain-containing protein, partial [Acidimicrobiia bacterium]|nr:neocarzinostatin apoprotein domain-containing protein [Acidimicrobiia bacterium]